MSDAACLAGLADAAAQADAAEAACRRDFAARIVALETARAHAWRRLSLLRRMAAAAAGAPDGTAAALGVCRAALGWPSVAADPGQTAVFERLEPIAAALAAATIDHAPAMLPPDDLPAAPPPPDAAALNGLVASFEHWFTATHGRSFWALLDRPFQETPVVDF